MLKILAIVPALVAAVLYFVIDRHRALWGDAPRGPVAGAPSSPGAAAPVSSVTRGRARVVDADTIEVDGVRIRLHGIDAPERDQSCRRLGVAWACGREATAALVGLVRGRDLRCDLHDRDQYGRMVGVCWIGALDVNGWLVGQGWAVAYRRYSMAYVEAEADARQARRGVWSGSFDLPEDYRRSNPRVSR